MARKKFGNTPGTNFKTFGECPNTGITLTRRNSIADPNKFQGVGRVLGKGKKKGPQNPNGKDATKAPACPRIYKKK